MCIYELMAEDSAVNYWEVRTGSLVPARAQGAHPARAQKYGHVAFDSNQKAVLTSCVLRYRPLLPTSGAMTPARFKDQMPPPSEEGFISCCFSFTIRRDTWGIPSMIVGNFIRL